MSPDTRIAVFLLFLAVLFVSGAIGERRRHEESSYRSLRGGLDDEEKL